MVRSRIVPPPHCPVHGYRAGLCTGPGPCDPAPLGLGKNWVTEVGGLPLYIRAIAHSLRRSGHSESSAIATAIATVKRWAAGGGKVTPATRARAAKAVAEWEAKKGAAHARGITPEGVRMFNPKEMRGPDGKWSVGGGVKKVSSALGIHHKKLSEHPAFQKESDRLSKASTLETTGDSLLHYNFTHELSAASEAQKKGNAAAAAKHLAAANVAEAVLRSRGSAPQFGHTQLRDMSGVTEMGSSASALLPVGVKPKQAQALEARLALAPKANLSETSHAFRGTNPLHCSVCGLPAHATIHRGGLLRPKVRAAPDAQPDEDATGERHRGPGHLNVQTGHVAGNLHRSRVAQKQAFNADADQLEPKMAAVMRRLFARQATETLAKMRSGTRADPPTPEQPQPPNLAPIFDLAYWADQTAQAAQSVYGAAGSLARSRVHGQLGAPEVDESGSLGALQLILRDRANRMAHDVSQTTFNEIQDQLAQGTANGESMGKLSKRVRNVFSRASKFRADNIARTEVVGALNEAANTYAQHLPPGIVGRKEWMAHHDQRTRPTHRMADGQRVPVNQPFHVGGFLMMHPGDPSAPPSEVCQCRCSVAYLPAPAGTSLEEAA